MSGKNRVARYQADRTNQKFYFCRLACKQAVQAVDKQIYQASCETAIFHLQGAYFAFLQELAQFYRIEVTAPSIEYLEEKLAEKTFVSPELERLKQVKQVGVLANILNAYQRCQFAPKPELPLTEVASGGDLIVNVVTLSNQWLPDEQTIRGWRQEFMDLIDALRAGMQEY
ncbi:DUF6586 family protein [Psychrobacter sp. I-STPA6b]|uniref:DUF6586 family protein n=1 Tax=Psychrobacter sp. I-STPA6b TaxID=2585718 RepID=UPI001D0CC3FE|nr:DUF6586 family protein [Psychrobacter sp. I-STPA6b]